MKHMLPLSVSVSLGQTMVEWHVYYSVVVANNQTQMLEGVCMQVVVVMLFLLPEFERMNVLYMLRTSAKQPLLCTVCTENYRKLQRGT